MSRALLLAWCLLLAAGRAHADPTPAELAAGRKAFDEARAELNLGRYDKALALFEDSYRLTGRAALLFNVAYTHRRLFERTGQLDHLEQSAERLRVFLRTLPPDPGSAAARGRGEQQLHEVEQQLAQERSARARGDELLALAERSLREQRLDDASRELERFIATPGTERPAMARAWALGGALAWLRGDPALAHGAFAKALALDPTLTAPAVLPAAARIPFAAAQKAAVSAGALHVEHVPPAIIKRELPVVLAFDQPPDPLGLIEGVRLHYRAGERGAFSMLAPSRVRRLTLPRELTRSQPPGGRIEYFAEILGVSDSVLERIGSAALPISAEIDRPTRQLARRWWFWLGTIGGAAVAATAIGVGVHFSQPSSTRIPLMTGLGLVK